MIPKVISCIDLALFQVREYQVNNFGKLCESLVLIFKLSRGILCRKVPAHGWSKQKVQMVSMVVPADISQRTVSEEGQGKTQTGQRAAVQEQGRSSLGLSNKHKASMAGPGGREGPELALERQERLRQRRPALTGGGVSWTPLEGPSFLLSLEFNSLGSNLQSSWLSLPEC